MKLSRMAMVALTSAALWVTTGSAFAANDTEPKKELKDIVLKGDAKCTECHDELDSPEALKIGKTKHGVGADKRTPTCTSCHGESDQHVKEAGRGSGPAPAVEVSFAKKSKNSAAEQSKACMSCHQGGKRMHWESSQHAAGDVSCTSCHKIHTQDDPARVKQAQAEVCYACHKEQRAQSFKASAHPVKDGKLTCSNCHNPHGSTGPKMLVKNTLNETCYTCHAEKRGPFLWEHPPATDDCATCHTPHGSNQPALLKARSPILCQQCHLTAGQGHPNTLRSGVGIDPTNAQTQVLAKGCVNCHSQVHGSNHPSGPRFVR